MTLIETVRALVRQGTWFLVSAAIGLAVDLGGYAVLVFAGLAPAFANAVSSAISVVVVYFVSSRFVFRSRGGRWTVPLFFGWYALAIVGISALVHLGVDSLGLQFFVAKLVTLPISFTANFLATRAIFRYSGRPATEPGNSD